MRRKDFKVILVSMSGVRVYNQALMQAGLTLPGFVERSRVIASLPSLGLLTIAGHTPGNWEIVYKEVDELTGATVSDMLAEQPDLVAFSSLTARINETYRLADQFRQAGITVVIGGLHASALPQEAMRHADSVIQGEGELAWRQLLEDVENNELKPVYSSLASPNYAFHFDSDVIPRYDLLDISRYNRLTIQATRGCPLHCVFCAASRTISTYKKKPLSLLEKELDAIFDTWKRPFIELADDNTFVDKKWSADLLKLFSRYHMRWFTETDISVADDPHLLELLAETGCAQVLIGFETSQRNALEGIDKANWKYKRFDQYLRSIEKIQSYGISVNGCFILGFDTDTKESLEHTRQFIEDSNLSEVQLTLLTPFPGTDLYRQLQTQGRLPRENFWDKCTLFDLVFEPAHFTKDELEWRFLELMTQVYSKTAVERRKTNFRNTLKAKANANGF